MDHNFQMGASDNMPPQLLKLSACAIDWLEFTLRGLFEWPYVCSSILGLMPEEFEILNRGASGYNNMVKHSSMDIKILFTTDPASPNYNTVHVELSGSGCKDFFTMYDWASFVGRLYDLDFASFTRLDVCFDDLQEVSFYTPESLKDICVNSSDDGQRVVTLWKQFNFIGACSFGSSNNDKGATLYLGSQKSNCFMRVYDKRAERIYKTGIDPKQNWVRWELVLKHINAQGFVQRLIVDHDFNLTECFLSTLVHYFNIYDHYDVKHPEYNILSPKWEQFTLWAEGAPIYFTDDPKDICTVSSWLSRQCSAALSAVLRADPEWIDKHINPNMYKQNKKYVSMVDSRLSLYLGDDVNNNHRFETF